MSEIKIISINCGSSLIKKDSELVFPHIFQLSASAGSGKTHNLSLRYVQFLLSSNIKTNGLDNIMAITFTNKSADEMKERILKLLKSIAIGRKDELNEIKNLLGGGSGNTDKYLEGRASALVDNIIKNYTNFNIKTIDSFLADILRAFLLETDISPGFEITTDKFSYIDYSIDALLSAVNEDEEIKKIFLDFIKNYVAVEGKTVFNPRYAITEIVRELGYIENNSGKYFSIPEEGDFIRKSHENIEKILDKIESLLGDLTSGIDRLSGAKLNKTFQKGLSKTIKKDFTSSYWKKKNVEGIITGFKGVQDAEASANLQKIWDDIRNSIKDIILSAGGIKFYSYIKILNKCKKIIDEKSKNDGVIFLDELKRRVNGLIKSNAVPDIYFNMGERIYHYLIDEFQDTDRLQWENLKALVENSISNGGSLFYVGDKKQSIYRFKGGDADLFDDIIDDFHRNIIPQGGFYAEKLKDNYRSKELLVNFFNETFNPENLIPKLLCAENKNNKADTSSPDISLDACYRKKVEELIHRIYENHEQHSALKDAGFKGFIYIERFSEPDSAAGDGTANPGRLNNGVNNGVNNGAEINPNVKALFLDKTVSVINDLKSRNYGFKDIAILARTNNDSSDIVLKLKEEKIPVKSDQSADVRNNRLIKETIAFLKFLNNPADNLSFINFISGKIFVSVFKNPALIKSEISNFILNNRKKDFIYLKFKEWNFKGEGGLNYTGSALWEDYLSELFDSAGFYPVYDTVCKFYEKFNIYEHFRGNNGFFMHLLELIKNRELEGENSSDMFIDFFEAANMEQEQFLTESSPANNAVNVLTMHKAKGLQFPAVIIPYAGIKKTPINRILTECGDIGGSAGAGGAAGSICLYYTNKGDQEILSGIDENIEEVKSYINEKSMNFIDELNLFYVSLTRAKDELYIMIPPKIGNNKNILNNLFFDKDTADAADSGNTLRIGDKKNIGRINGSGSRNDNAGNNNISISEERFNAQQSGQSLEDAYFACSREAGGFEKYGWKRHLFGAAKREDIERLYSQQSGQLILDENSRQKGFLKGNVLHFILSKVDFLSEGHFIYEIKKLTAEGLKKFSGACSGLVLESGLELELNAENISGELIGLLNLTGVRNWFFTGADDKKDLKNFNEKEIVDGKGELKRIDRIVISRNEISVIDYKTGFPNENEIEKYKKQVDGYIDIISGAGIYPDKNISGYILYIDKKEVQKVR